MKFLTTISPDVWLNRHAMIAMTTMMLVAESYGFDTAPMKGFDPEAVKREFGVPRKRKSSRCWPSDAGKNRRKRILAAFR